MGPAAASAARPGKRGYPHPPRLLPQIIHCLNRTTPHPPPPPWEPVTLGRGQKVGQAGPGWWEIRVGRGDIHKGATANAKNRRKNIYIHIYKENLIKQGKTKEHLNYSGFRHSEKWIARVAKETRKESSQGLPAAMVDRLGLVSDLDQLQCKARSCLPHTSLHCVFSFLSVFFPFFFLFITHSPTLHTQLCVLNETPEPRSVEFFSCCFWELFIIFFKRNSDIQAL